MISVYAIKPAFQNRLRPIAYGLHNRGVTANQVTLAALLLSLAVGSALWLWPTPLTWLLLPPILLLRMALNALDGMLARELQGPTPLGALLNELGDVVADAGLYLPLLLLPGLSAAAIVAFVLLALLSEFCGVLGVQIGASRRYDGPMGKSDRALLLGGIALLLGFGMSSGVWLHALLWIANGLLVLTCYNRLYGALQESKACP